MDARAAVLTALVLAFLPGAAARRCLPGSAPGGWQALEHGEREPYGPSSEEGGGWFRLEGGRAAHHPLSVESPSGPLFGENWRSYDRSCPLQNLLRAHLEPSLAASAKPATLVLMGDSLDASVIEFVCAEAAARKVSGWRAFSGSHTLANYCFLPSGLRILQLYILSASLDDDLRQLEVAQRLFASGEDDISRFDGIDRASLEGRAEELATLAGGQPDLVVFAAAYWPLQKYAASVGDERPTPIMLPDSFVTDYQRWVGALLAACRAAFPAAQIAVHTSPGLRTDSETGTNVLPVSQPRIWGKKSYFAQLNAALRVLVHAGHAKLLDLELMAAALTAAPQLTRDDLHPRSFFMLEVVNVMLNMASYAPGPNEDG